MQQNALEIGAVKRDCRNGVSRKASLIERLAGAMLPVNALDHPGMFNDLFANSEFQQHAEGVRPHRNCCSYVEEFGSLLEDFWFEAKMSKRQGRSQTTYTATDNRDLHIDIVP
jgi:hypothetical protein